MTTKGKDNVRLGVSLAATLAVVGTAAFIADRFAKDPLSESISDGRAALNPDAGPFGGTTPISPVTQCEPELVQRLFPPVYAGIKSNLYDIRDSTGASPDKTVAVRVNVLIKDSNGTVDSIRATCDGCDSVPVALDLIDLKGLELMADDCRAVINIRLPPL